MSTPSSAARSLRATLVAITISALVFFNSGCGSNSGGQSAPKPPAVQTPVSAVLSLSKDTVFEGGSAEVLIWVDLTPQVSRSVWVRLGFEGSASLGLDFEIDEQNLIFRPNQTRATTTLRVLDDWLAEDEETLTIRLSEFSNATAAGLPAHADITLQDNGDVALTREDKNGQADLYVWTDPIFAQNEVSYEIVVINFGNVESPSTALDVSVYPLFRPNTVGSAVQRLPTIEVPPLEKYSSFETRVAFDLREFQQSQTYWTEVDVYRVEDERDGDELPNWEWNGFTLDSNRNVMVRCEPPGRTRPTTSDDPLFVHQWSLQNDGQRAFAANGGRKGEDIRMQTVLTDGSPTGRGVKVAVVDTGLEICHPDMAENIATDGSYNFKASIPPDDSWVNALASDPFLPESRGDHGTSVAGIIGAVANNGLGLRGIAPNVSLYGFNFLSEQCCYEDALGGSAERPNSEQIDVFNMSFGTLGFQGNAGENSIMRDGANRLRGGRGAIYVKAAGNSFGSCINFEHQAHDTVGCSSSNGDPSNNLPYLIVVGALDADGKRAWYSSVGSNLWISAPAGIFGVDEPATITTDQFSVLRGYSSRNYPGIARDRTADPYGDYNSNFNGTSAAAPHVSGIVALLLEVEPNLTWRDVKHILAATARKSDLFTAQTGDLQVVIGDHLAVLHHGWIKNAAGYEYHNYYGFGAANVDAALALVRGGYQADGLGEQRLSPWIVSSVDGLSIADHDGRGIEQRLNVALATSSNIEAVQLHIVGEHENLVDLSIELTSPAGTRSILNPVFNNFLTGSTWLDWRLLSNAFYGESPNGSWTLRVIDAAAGDTGMLSSWGLRIWYGDHP